jgi:hypothetical protein
MEKFNLERVLPLSLASICGVVLAVVTGAPQWAGSEVAAAWTQAIFSVAAILASTRLWQADKERIARERRQQQQIADFRVAVMHLPLLVAAMDAIDQIYVRVNRANDMARGGDWLEFAPNERALEPLANIVDELKGCSPPLEADALAAASWARQYIHQVQLRVGFTTHPSGQRLHGMKPVDWEACAGALFGAKYRAGITVGRLQVILESPPDLRDR